MTKQNFLYVTYIAATQEAVWQAFVDMEVTRKYWMDPAGNDPAHVNVSDWKTGSRWEHQRDDATRTIDIVGRIVESNPPSRLAFTWARPKDAADNSKHSRVSFDIEPHGERLIRLAVTHEDLDPQMHAGVSAGWPKILSNLKTLLETHRALPRAPSASTAEK